MARLRSKIASLFKPTARPSLFLYLGLRFLQFGAATLGLAFFCSLIGWHNAHYCTTRFYRNRCTPAQREHATVPLRYINFVVLYCVMIIAAFGLACRHISSVLGSSGSTDLSNDDKATDCKRNTSPFLKLCRRIFRSAPKLALLLDSTFLVVVTICLYEYMTRVIYPNHMHPGYASPICILYFEHSREFSDPSYWKNLRVEKQRCMDNLISYHSTMWLVGWTTLLVIFDVIYLRNDLSKKQVLKDEALTDALEKEVLIDIAA